MARLYIHPTARIGSLANQQVLDINAQLSGLTIENDLRREIRGNIRRLRDMGTYRGRRHAMSMPVRGQRTRTQVRKLFPLTPLFCSFQRERERESARDERFMEKSGYFWSDLKVIVGIDLCYQKI